MSEREKIGIVTDSASMISPDVAERLGVEVVPLWVHFGDDSKDSFNDHKISAAEVKRIFEEKGGRIYPSTSSPSPGEFIVAYDKRLDLGADQILSIHIAKGIRSGTFLAAEAAARKVRQEYELPESAIKVFDSKQVALATGFLVRESVNLISHGESFQNTVSTLEEMQSRLKTMGIFKNLNWVKKTKAVPDWFIDSWQLAINLLKIAPIIQIVDGKWKKIPIALPKRPLAIKRLAELALTSGKIEKAGIFHFDAHNDAEKLASYIEKAEGYKPEIVEVPASIAAGAGPGAVGICILEK